LERELKRVPVQVRACRELVCVLDFRCAFRARKDED